MELALYDVDSGYYARAARRSGRAGDFFTSVDVGPLFGDLLERQLAEMADILRTIDGALSARTSNIIDIVEAGAGNGRLAADILRAAQARHHEFYDRIALHLIEASPQARAAHRSTLGPLSERLVSSSSELPASFEGVLIANELLDAMPVHQLVMREDGLREVYVDIDRAAAFAPGGPLSQERIHLRTVEGPLSAPDLTAYLERLDVQLEPGWRVEVNLRACEWIRGAARRLRRGFIIIIDYGHAAQELYSACHARGTLTTFARHMMAGAEAAGGVPRWLASPGDEDITSHVDFTSVRVAAEREGLETIAFLDQTYFLLGILGAGDAQPGGMKLDELETIDDRVALRTLIMPGSLGSTHKVLILGKGVGAPALSGCSYRIRVT